MKTAKILRRLEDYTGVAYLCHLDPPLAREAWSEEDQPPSYEHVVVSATVASYSGPETYIFGADEAGEVAAWGELPGSYRGGLDHEEALRGAGYDHIVWEQEAKRKLEES